MVATVSKVEKETRPRPASEKSMRTDAQIAAAIRRALEWDEFVPHRGIRSAVSNGWVTLEGNVSTSAERDYVERIVRLLAGVAGVQNLLRLAGN